MVNANCALGSARGCALVGIGESRIRNNVVQDLELLSSIYASAMEGPSLDRREWILRIRVLKGIHPVPTRKVA